MAWTRRQFLRTSTASLLTLSAMGMRTAGVLGQSQPTLKIGAILTLTGGNAITGQAIRDGARVAEATINESGGLGNRFGIDLVVEDSQTKQTEAVNAANRLASRGDVSFVIGPIIASLGLAVQPILAAAEIPQLFFGASRDFLAQHERFPLSIMYGTELVPQHAPVIKYAAEQRGHRNLYVLAPNTDRGQDAMESLRGRIEQLDDGRVVGADVYPPFNTDFSTLVTKAQNSDADGVFLATGIPAEIIAAAQEFKRQGIDVEEFGFYTSRTPNGSIEFRDQLAATGEAEGLIFPWLYASPQMARDFDAKVPSLAQASRLEMAFQRVMGEPMAPINGQLVAWGWDGIQVIHQAIERLIERDGAAAVTSLDPVRELPQAVIAEILPDSGADTGPPFETAFGTAGFLSCGQFNTRYGVATFDGPQQRLLTPRGYGNELIGSLCP